MGLKSQMATRAVFETILTLAGWALLIGAVVSFFNSELGLGIVMVVATVICFALSANSAKRSPTLRLVMEASLEALRQVERGDFAQGLATAEEADEAARSVRGGEHARPMTLAVLSVARAVNGDMPAARAFLAMAIHQAPATILKEEMPKLLDMISGALDRGVPDGRGLARTLIALK